MGMIVFPLAFISSAYIPVATLPGWLQAFANHQPLTPMVDTIRALTLGPDAQTILGHPAAHYLVPSLIWTAAILVLFMPLAVGRYGRG
jgi:ABC-type multidrug transport system permease subunit